jgi:hypothetical protein
MICAEDVEELFRFGHIASPEERQLLADEKAIRFGRSIRRLKTIATLFSNIIEFAYHKPSTTQPRELTDSGLICSYVISILITSSMVNHFPRISNLRR